MTTFKIGDKEYPIACGAWTPVLYEQEFGKDMIQDVFGRISFGQDDVVKDGEVFVMNFTNTNWTASIRALWACLKTADDSVDPFEIWVKKQGSLDMDEIQNYVATEVVKQFFPSRVGDSDQTAEGEE